MDYAALCRYVNVPRETFTRLERYVALLQKWNPRINLVADTSPDTLWQRHILDCLQLLDHIPSDRPLHICDLGSGAGLPGIILAITTPHPVILVESDVRKGAFLRQACLELTIANATVLTDRIEHCRLKADLVTARALAPLIQLLSYSAAFLKEDAFCLFLKGTNWDKEVRYAVQEWEFALEAIPSLTSAESRILKLKNIAKIDS